jgi:hypothetical protein
MVEIISTILHPVSMSLSISAWLINADFDHFLHSYVDAQSTDISGVNMLMILGVMSPLNHLVLMYILISSHASAYYVDS